MGICLTLQVRQSIHLSIKVGELIHTLQKERDITTLHVSELGSKITAFLLKTYVKTDADILSLKRWPTSKRIVFTDNKSFQAELNAHRNNLNMDRGEIISELLYYTDLIDVFVEWLHELINVSAHGILWKSLIGYQKLVSAKVVIGIERALGGMYFVQGGFKNNDNFDWFNRMVNEFKAIETSAIEYSDFIRITLANGIMHKGLNLTKIITDSRSDILRGHNRIAITPSLSKATKWFDNMSLYIDELNTIQHAVADNIIEETDALIADITSSIFQSSILMAIVIILCPIITWALKYIHQHIDKYVIRLENKTMSLVKEKMRTMDLLCLLLPNSIAMKLKHKQQVRSEYFDSVTILTSDIDGFAEFSRKVDPIKLIHILNEMYALIDGIMKRYDVYKVGAVNDSYIISSGRCHYSINIHRFIISAFCYSL